MALAGLGLLGVVIVLLVANRRGLRAWYLLLVEFERLEDNARGYPVYRHERTGLLFVHLPGGRVTLGCPPTEKGRLPWEGERDVVLSPFLIGVHEVTEKAWTAVLGPPPTRHPLGEQFPVHEVSRNDAQAFCKATGLELPTEAQWEYACRAGSRGEFAGDLEDVAWYRANSGGLPHAVGQKKPNGFGLHDMHGNVHEWCRDAFDRDIRARGTKPERDPVVTSGTLHELRGGGCESDPRYCRSAARNSDLGSSRLTFVGFRPVLDLR